VASLSGSGDFFVWECVVSNVEIIVNNEFDVGTSGCGLRVDAGGFMYCVLCLLPVFTYLLTPWSRVLLEKLTSFRS
jgi:hypothetical protein